MVREVMGLPQLLFCTEIITQTRREVSRKERHENNGSHKFVRDTYQRKFGGRLGRKMRLGHKRREVSPRRSGYKGGSAGTEQTKYHGCCWRIAVTFVPSSN